MSSGAAEEEEAEEAVAGSGPPNLPAWRLDPPAPTGCFSMCAINASLPSLGSGADTWGCAPTPDSFCSVPVLPLDSYTWPSPVNTMAVAAAGRLGGAAAPLPLPLPSPDTCGCKRWRLQQRQQHTALRGPGQARTPRVQPARSSQPGRRWGRTAWGAGAPRLPMSGRMAGTPGAGRPPLGRCGMFLACIRTSATTW